MIRRFIANSSLVVACAAILFAGGCASSSADEQQSKRLEGVNAIVEPSPLLDISEPLVIRDGDDITISGTVTRRPGDEGPVDGHLHVVIYAKDAQTVLNQFPISWMPDPIPVDGARQSKYEVRYGYLPPAGSTIVIYLSDRSDVLPRGTGNSGSNPFPSISQSNTFSTKTPGTPGMSPQPRTPGTPRSGK